MSCEPASRLVCALKKAINAPRITAAMYSMYSAAFVTKYFPVAIYLFIIDVFSFSLALYLLLLFTQGLHCGRQTP